MYESECIKQKKTGEHTSYTDQDMATCTPTHRDANK